MNSQVPRNSAMLRTKFQNVKMKNRYKLFCNHFKNQIVKIFKLSKLELITHYDDQGKEFLEFELVFQQLKRNKVSTYGLIQQGNL